MSTDLRGQHDLGEIVGYGYRLYAANFRTLFSIALITAPVQMLAAVVLRQIDDEAAATGAAWLFQIPALIVGLIASAALVYAIHGITEGNRPEPMAAIDAAFERMGAVLSTGLLALTLVFLAFFSWPFMLVWWLRRRGQMRIPLSPVLLPVILAPYLAVRWQFIGQSVMIEDRRRWAALDTSALLVEGTWWRVFGIMVVITLIQLGPLGLAALSSAAPPLIEATVTSLVGSLVLPFAVAAQTLLYYDLKARKHAALGPA